MGEKIRNNRKEEKIEEKHGEGNIMWILRERARKKEREGKKGLR